MQKTENNRIREFRTQLGWTQARLAEEVGTTAQNIGLIERGGSRLTLDWMTKIAAALNVRPEDLLPGSRERLLDKALLGNILLGIREYENHRKQKLTAEQFASAATDVYEFAKTEAKSKDPNAITDALSLYLTSLFNQLQTQSSDRRA